MLKKAMLASASIMMLLTNTINTHACTVQEATADKLATAKWEAQAMAVINSQFDDIRICRAKEGELTVLKMWVDEPYEGNKYALNWDVEEELGETVEVKFDNRGTIWAYDDRPVELWKLRY